MDKLTRIAIVSEDRCKPKKCKQECKRLCPVVSMGKLCIEVDINVKVATISETLCNGCGICAKVCPYNAISIINLPTNLTKETTHRYNQNSFKLHRLPIPKSYQILGSLIVHHPKVILYGILEDLNCKNILLICSMET